MRMARLKKDTCWWQKIDSARFVIRALSAIVVFVHDQDLKRL